MEQQQFSDGVFIQRVYEKQVWGIFLSPQPDQTEISVSGEDGEHKIDIELTNLAISFLFSHKEMSLGLLVDQLLELLDTKQEDGSQADPRFALIEFFRQPTDAMRCRLIKVSRHLEEQKWGKGTDESITWLSQRNKEVWIRKIRDGKPVGLDLTELQQRAVFAIQKLLAKTNYLGNLKGIKLDGENSFQFTGYLPQVKFTSIEFFESCGLERRETTRGKSEFSQKERKEALEALYSLSQIQVLFTYERKYYKGGHLKTDVVVAEKPLIEIMWELRELSEEEYHRLDAGQYTQAELDRRGTIGITPSPVFVDQLQTYFLLKPANIYQESGRIIKGKHPKYIPLFLEWINSQGQLQLQYHKELIVRINYRKLAEKLRMDSYIKKRQWTRIRKVLKKAYDVACQAGYLQEYRTVPGASVDEVEVFILNPARFTRGEKRDGYFNIKRESD